MERPNNHTVLELTLDVRYRQKQGFVSFFLDQPENNPSIITLLFNGCPALNSAVDHLTAQDYITMRREGQKNKDMAFSMG
ncbi:MAG: hypothetical protein JXA89_00025 [Anaerolineae bacterium]|nr:hypothetical protein [Anaerolineae bacterium]